MAAHEAEFSVKSMCRVLAVQRSGYYAWKRRPVSCREKENDTLLVAIRAAFELSRMTYGRLRIQAYLRRKGHVYSRFRIGRLMKKAHLVPSKAA